MFNEEASAPPQSAADAVERVTHRLKERLLLELESLESELDSEAATKEQSFKVLSGFFKMVQSVDQMIDGFEQRREREREHEVDIVEFRRALEKQIARLIESEEAQLIC